MSIEQKIRKADWEAWLENPITKEFFTEIERHRDEAKAYWDAVSWGGEDLWREGRDGRAYAMRCACRARYEMAQAIREVTLLEEEDEAPSED